MNKAEFERQTNESGGISVEEIKEDLKEKCSQIPLRIWSKRFPDLQIPLFEYSQSSLLPENACHIDSNGNHWVMGHDMVKSFLARNGSILEKLVHYETDGYDSQVRFADEFLGEASDKNYEMGYAKAKFCLNLLEEDALKAGEFL